MEAYGAPVVAVHGFAGGKRAPGAEVNHDAHSKKRAAFEDITNQFGEAEALGASEYGEPCAASCGYLQPQMAQQQQQLGKPGAAAYGQACGRVLPPYTLAPPPPARGCRPAHVDIDSEDRDDPMACTTYVNDIFEYLRESELKRRPTTTYMESVQSDINPMMRSILLDWLVEVGMEYRLTSDTLFLSAAYIDRFLSLVDVKRNRLQLVGVTAMLVASKYEEIYAPQVEEFCYITDNTYTREQVLEMERELLRVLDFDLTQPTIKTFLRRYIKAASGEIPLDVTFEFLCSYLAELTLMDYGMLNYLPSMVAAACVTVALVMLGKPHWTATLSHYSGYLPRDLRHCAQAVHALFVQAKTSNLPASRDKYASGKYASVSQLGCPDALPEWMFQ